MKYFYWTGGEEVKGPLSLGELERLSDEELPRTLVCLEGQSIWQPLVSVLPKSRTNVGFNGGLADYQPYVADHFSEPAPLPSDHPQVAAFLPGNWSPGVQQRVVILGGLLCFLFGVGVMYFSVRAFLVYTPLFFMALVLSVAAVVQKRIISGVLLLLITIIALPMQWLLHQRHSVGSVHEDTQKTAVQRGTPSINKSPSEVAASTPVIQSVKDATETEKSPVPQEKASGNSQANLGPDKTAVAQEVPSRIVALNSDSAPIVYELKAAVPTPRETIARYVLGDAYQGMDEFSKHDFVAKLDAMIKQRTADATPDALYSVSALVKLGEYNFDKQAFPIGDTENKDGRVAYKSITITPNANGDSQSNSTYHVCFANSDNVNFVRVDLERAKTLGPSLRQSRQAVVSFIGTLQKCVASTENGNDTSKKIILLNIQEVQLTLKQSGQSVSYKIPAQDRAEEQENSSAAKSAPNFPVSVTERLTEDQIKSLDIDQVQYAIDAIYGRYGAEFPKRETQAWLERQPWYSGVPGRTPDMVETMFTEDQKFNVDLLAERRNELRSASSESSSEIGSPDGSANSVAGGHNPPGAPTALATPMPTDRPAPADTSQTEPTRPALEGFAELSPERAVTDVWNTNPQNTVANFRRQYSGKTIRYSGTVARKNAKERLIIFKGGGFMTSAYDVQVSLNEDKTPGFSDVAVGDRLVIVATMDRIVPPAFGVGSSSIRLSDGWIYKKSK